MAPPSSMTQGKDRAGRIRKGRASFNGYRGKSEDGLDGESGRPNLGLFWPFLCDDLAWLQMNSCSSGNGDFE